MPANTCRACDTAIQWVRSMTRDGFFPVDISPDPDEGTVRKHFSGDEVSKKSAVVYGEVLKGDDLNKARADGERLWMRHSDTCSAKRPFNPRPAHVQLDLPTKGAKR